MNTTLLNKFINGKIFGYIVSTNLKPDYKHETFLLGYTFIDLVCGRYSEFWSKFGGYKENFILFPNTDLTIQLQTPEHPIKILFKYVIDFQKFVEDCKEENLEPAAKKPGTLMENYYNPNFMYMRYYNFGTCKKDIVNDMWNIKINNIECNGMTIRDIELLKQFGYVIRFEELARYCRYLIRNEKSEKSVVEEKDFEKLKTENKEFKNYINKLQHENEIYKSKIIELNKTNEDIKQSIINIKSTYDEEIRNERKSIKAKVKNEERESKRITKEYNKLTDKYNAMIENYETQINILKSNLSKYDEPKTNEVVKVKTVLKESKNYWFDIILFVMILSIILNITQYVYKIYGLW